MRAIFKVLVWLRFFATLKKELIRPALLATRVELRAAVFDYIEIFYNSTRRPLHAWHVIPG